MAFSGAVKLASLDDYLAPSQNCIKPLLDQAKSAKKGGILPPTKGGVGEQKEVRGVVRMEMEDDIGIGHFDQIKSRDGRAAITLADCLACSGCVTSAETMLITQQSTAEFEANLRGEARKRLVVVSLSPQSRTALSHFFKIPPLPLIKRLTTFLKSVGVDHVLDTTCGLDISLLEAREEFVQRYRAKTALPVLSSECPGWVCYAEKTQGAEILPFISAIKSPQQIMGTIVKKFIAAHHRLTGADVYHVCVMPCYDKKLEGTRPDFFDEASATRDVDCVLSTDELKEFILKSSNLATLTESVLHPFNSVSQDQSMLVLPLDVGGSGGYAENIFRYSVKVLFGADLPAVLVWEKGRNPDFHEVSHVQNGQKVLTFARAYGFRNIQNLVRTIKRQSCTYHYVELMACPAGCLNGGGQIKAASIAAQKQLVTDLDILHHQERVRPIGSNPVVEIVYRDLVRGPIGSAGALAHFRTQYRAVEKIELTNPMAIKW
jgi:iron only hydrogenase large subunit-like protein